MGHSKILNLAFEKVYLLKEVVDFKKRFYPCSWARYDLADIQTFELLPSEYNSNFLKEDYKKMKTLIFGDYPNWEDIIEYLKELEVQIHELYLN